MTVLPPIKPDPMEEAVARHLAKTLDGQRGRAAAAFHAAVASGFDGAPALLISDERNRVRNIRTLKIWATAASALAACLAVMVTLQAVSYPVINPIIEPKNQTLGIAGIEPTSAKHGTPLVVDGTVPMMDQVELSREVDGGTALVQDSDNGPAMPVRIVRQQTLRQSQWFDPNEKATYRLTQPVETVNYQQIQPY